MIDTHCHLEQSDYDKDRDALIERMKKELDAVITSCANPKDWKLTMEMVERHANFMHATASIHPEYIKELSAEEIDNYVELIKRNRDKIVAIGETGLDYWWTEEEEWREKQKALFIRLIELAKELDLPLVIHARKGKDGASAVEDVVHILEQEGAKRAQMHMFSSRALMQRVLDNGWMISVNGLMIKSKGIRKIVRDTPIERLMLETDAPWLAVDENGYVKDLSEKRNDPLTVKAIAQKISEIKKVSVDEVDRITTENAKRFFRI